jgi:hypothetical protein
VESQEYRPRQGPAAPAMRRKAERNFKLGRYPPPQVLPLLRGVVVRAISPEGMAFGTILLAIGLMCWCFEATKDFGVNIASAGFVLLLANALKWMQPRVVRLLGRLGLM